jgi:predicted Zn finger-like uncharacterized protein
VIVTCQNCETSFQLDESRIPAQGIRVRCSRCKQAFFLEHPSASRSEAVDAVAREAVTGRAKRAPDATEDLAHASEVRRAAPPRSTSGPHANSEDVDNEDEWVFNQDVPGQDDSERDLAGDPEVFDRAAEAAGSGLSLAEEEDAVAAPSEGADESVFGSVDDFSSLVGDEVPSISEVDDSVRESLVQAGSVGVDEEVAEAAAGDDLGDPESWDFFGDASLEGGGGRSVPGAEGGHVGLASRASARDPMAGRDFDEADYADGVEQTAMATWSAHVGRAMGWLATLLLVGMGLVSGLGYGSETLVRSQPALDLSPMRADSIRAVWMETARSGRLLVVTADLHNPSAQPAVPDRMLEVAILDASGHPLPGASSIVGLALPEAQLRELARDELLTAQNKAARALSRSPVASRDKLTVQALFLGLPEGGARFLLRSSERQVEASTREPDGESLPGQPAGTPLESDPSTDPLLDL